MRNQVIARGMHGLKARPRMDVQQDPKGMAKFIIDDMKKKIQPHLPAAVEKFPALEQYTIFQGKDILQKVPEELKGALDPENFYLVFKMSGQGSRQQAADLFKFIMEEKLGMPRSTGSALDEILPKKEYNPLPPARQLEGPKDDVIDMDPDTGEMLDPAKKAVQVDVKPRFYAVEIKVVPAPMDGNGDQLLPPPNRRMALPRGADGMLPFNEAAGKAYKIKLSEMLKFIEDQKELLGGDDIDVMIPMANTLALFGQNGKIQKLYVDEWPTAKVCESGDDMSAEDKKTAEELGMKDDMSEDDVLDGRNHNLHVDEEEDSSEDQGQEEEINEADVSNNKLEMVQTKNAREIILGLQKQAKNSLQSENVGPKIPKNPYIKVYLKNGKEELIDLRKYKNKDAIDTFKWTFYYNLFTDKDGENTKVVSFDLPRYVEMVAFETGKTKTYDLLNDHPFKYHCISAHSESSGSKSNPNNSKKILPFKDAKEYFDAVTKSMKPCKSVAEVNKSIDNAIEMMERGAITPGVTRIDLKKLGKKQSDSEELEDAIGIYQLVADACAKSDKPEAKKCLPALKAITWFLGKTHDKIKNNEKVELSGKGKSMRDINQKFMQFLFRGLKEDEESQEEKKQEVGLDQFKVDEDELDKKELELFESVSGKLRSQLV